MSKKAVMVMSGGLDSTTVAAIAVSQGFELYGLSFHYEQRHVIELRKAKLVADRYCKEHRILHLDLGMLGGSALTDKTIAVPKFEQVSEVHQGGSVTYVPARNTIFLSFAVAWAEVLGVQDIFFGANKTDYEIYPDCRPEYIHAFENMIDLATRAGTHNNKHFKIHAPLIDMYKSDVVRTGLELGVDYSNTLSCYSPSEQSESCGHCSSCLIRLDAFHANKIQDPSLYISK